MAKVKPFRGVRPPKEFVTEVASRPYDVLNGEEARSEAEGNPKSLYHIIKPEIDFEPGKDEHAPEVYERAVENFNAFQREGWLVQDDKEHYYIYAQTMDGRTQYGIVVAANVADYMEGRIKKHELTRRDKEEDRMKHVRRQNNSRSDSRRAGIRFRRGRRIRPHFLGSGRRRHNKRHHGSFR